MKQMMTLEVNGELHELAVENDAPLVVAGWLRRHLLLEVEAR